MSVCVHMCPLLWKERLKCKVNHSFCVTESPIISSPAGKQAFLYLLINNRCAEGPRSFGGFQRLRALCRAILLHASLRPNSSPPASEHSFLQPQVTLAWTGNRGGNKVPSLSRRFYLHKWKYLTIIIIIIIRKNLEAVPGKRSIDSLEKTAILGTSHIIRKVLQCEAWSLSGGDHRWFKRSTRKKRPW